MSAPKQATLYRMIMPDHTCPYELKSLDLLNREDYEAEDKHLASREQTDVFKKEHDVETMLRVFINGRCVGGYDDLRKLFGMSMKDKNAVIYIPVIALFVMVVAVALAASWAAFDQLWNIQATEWFVAFTICLLAPQKFEDVDGFAAIFLNYDLLAKRWARYAYSYPFVEAVADVLMATSVGMWVSIPLVLFIGAVGVVSTFKAVYVDRRELKCTCVGGDSNVPLGFVSLTEDLMVVAMALWVQAEVAHLGMH